MTFYWKMRKQLNKGGWATIMLIATIVVASVAFILGTIGAVWSLWTWVVPQIWATGPENFINPGYWLFVGMWFLVVFVAGLFKR